MGLIPDRNPVGRSPEDIDRMLSLVRRYWNEHPYMRFELVVSEFTPDYHYNSDEQIETALRAAVAKAGG